MARSQLRGLQPSRSLSNRRCRGVSGGQTGNEWTRGHPPARRRAPLRLTWRRTTSAPSRSRHPSAGEVGRVFAGRRLAGLGLPAFAIAAWDHDLTYTLIAAEILIVAWSFHGPAAAPSSDRKGTFLIEPPVPVATTSRACSCERRVK
jgi:hypothetical protein